MKKLLSLLISVILVFSVCAPACSAADDVSPMPDYTAPIKNIRAIKNFLYTVTGDEKFLPQYMTLILDDTMTEIAENISEKSGIDFCDILTRIPSTNGAAEFVGRLFCRDTDAFIAELNADAADLRANGEIMKSVIERFFAVWLGKVTVCEAICVPVEGQPELLQLTGAITYADGSDDYMRSDVFYNTETKTFTDKDGGAALLGYYLDVENGVVYTGNDVWQRNFGFCLFYDHLAYCTHQMDYVTTRIKFGYADMDWMIQLWKGRYFICNGGEIGIYNRPEHRIGTFYNCVTDDEMLYSDMEILHGGESILYRDRNLTWWNTGFRLSGVTYDPASLTMKSTITMKDEEMLTAFTDALAKKKDIAFTVDGLDVSFVW